ncbi:MAG: acetate--CoA ligase family protein [Candidatus Binatus sp.]|uniref:acetate--CoA ligase family protein n=1 Tax=Candidatus Binatus sp. TaxID=2811406 RepID=UPI00271BACBD|nr:acetate--CoA ligase family protein [Candidatus Binatus sp.]MDO8431078.1 acetate--CoA ligase family protein [Candidatus Binatus sp.]
MSSNRPSVRAILDRTKQAGRTSLHAAECAELCRAYDISIPSQALASSASQAVKFAGEIGYPLAMKIASPDILHKTEANGIILNVIDSAEVETAFRHLLARAKAYNADARIDGVLIQKMAVPGVELIVGASTDPSFGKVVAVGVGGVMVEVLNDITFHLAPVSVDEARAMVAAIRSQQFLNGVRGGQAVNREALASLICAVSRLVDDFPEIAEIDLNPVFASPDGAVAADVRIVLDFEPPPERFRPSRDQILIAMNRIMRPESVAIIGASAEDGKIGNSVLKNLINGGYRGRIVPIHPSLDSVLGLKAYRSLLDVPDPVDVAVFAIPARLVAQVLHDCGARKVAGAVLIPSGFAETGNVDLQNEVLAVARQHDIRLMGPNIYGFYYTPQNLCATFCTPYDVKGKVALSSQSGGVGMAILGFSRSTKMGVSAIVGLGNKADIDEDDLLTFFEEDPDTQVIAMHVEDLKDGRSFAEVAKRVSARKPVIMLKAGRTAAGARAARSHTAALAGNDRIYDDVLRHCGVVRAYSLNDMLEFARCLPMIPTPRGENVLIITGAGGSGVLLADACVEFGLKLMTMPPDLDQAFRKFIPPFGAAGNPVDITGGEPPTTYQNTIQLGLQDSRVHSLVLGYWHTIITPPLVFAKLTAEVVEAERRKGNHKPIVASLVGDVEVEEACAYLFDRQIPAYPYTTEKPVAVLGAKYRWARNNGLLAN